MSVRGDQMYAGTSGHGGHGGYGDDYGHYGHSGGGYGHSGGGTCVPSPEQWLGAVLIAGAGVAVAGAAFGALFLTLTQGKRRRRRETFRRLGECQGYSQRISELFLKWNRIEILAKHDSDRSKC